MHYPIVFCIENLKSKNIEKRSELIKMKFIYFISKLLNNISSSISFMKNFDTINENKYVIKFDIICIYLSNINEAL